MRTRLLVPLAALAAALLAPSAALAADPLLSQPPSPTATGPVALSWTDVTGEDGYRVFRADADCSTNLTNITDLAAGDLAPDTVTFADNSPLEGTHCYFVRPFVGLVESPDSNHVLVAYDTTPPTGSVTSPANGAILSANGAPIVLTATADDATAGVASVEFFSAPTGLTTWTSLGSDSSGPGYSVNWSPANGTYDIYALITDDVGRTVDTLTVAGVLIDSTVPTGTLTPPAAAIRGSAVALTASAADAGGSGLDTVEFQSSPAGVGSWTTFDTDTAASANGTLVSTGLVDGLYDLRVRITDGAGNVGVSSTVANIRVDNTLPVATLTSPGAAIRGSAVALTASVTDAAISSVDFQRSPTGAGTWTTFDTDNAASSLGTLDTTAVADGAYDLRVRVTDTAGNVGVSPTVTSAFDNTVPTGSLTAPTAGALLRGTTNGLTANASNTGPGTPSVTFERSPRLANTWTTISTDSTAPFTANWNTTGLDGSFDLHVVVTDAAGNVATSAAVQVSVDNTAPTGYVTAPSAGAFLRGSTNGLTATASDAGPGTLSVAFERSNGGGWTLISTDTTAPYTANWDTGVLNGSFDIHVVVTDGTGNAFTSVAVPVTVDNTAPTTPGTPTGLTPVSAAPTITFTPSTDGGSGIDHYDIYRSPGSVLINAAPIAAGGPYTWSDAGAASNSPAVSGNYTYTVVAVDAAGNQATSGGKTIFLDPSGASAPAPISALASPTTQRPQISWGAPVTLPAFTLHHYKVYRGGTFVQDVTGATTFTDNTVGLADGSYTYQVVAASVGDGTLGIASAPVTVVYDTTVPTAPGGVSATAALDGSITVAWTAASDAGSGVARYVVRRSLSSSAPVSAADGDATCQGLVTTCADATTLNGKLYTYSVFAVDAVGNASAAGVSASVTARDQLAPAVPAGLAATAGDGTVDLRWAAAEADDDVAGYVLVAKAGSAAPVSEADGTRVCTAIVAGSTSCTATGLTNGATYTFGLFALDEALNRSQPAVVSAAPNGRVSDTKAPAAVTKLQAEVKGTAVTLTWKNPSDRDFDHVLITSSERAPAKLEATKRVYSGKGTKATTKVATGATRWFTVVAYDGAGNASPAATVRVAVKKVVTSSFGPAPKAKVHGKVRLSWPKAKGAKYYNVQLFAGKKRILVSWPAGRAFQLPRAKLKRGTTYTWYVWPGIGAKAKAHYGKLIGKNTFTFTG